MAKKFDYYAVDAGHFKVAIKLCFSNKAFQEILQDHDMNIKATALDMGIGETHYIADGREGIIVLAFDLDECDRGPAYLAGIIAHEATHCVCRIFEHIGEEVDEIGEESRAYLTEHIVAQLTQAIINEKDKNAGKRNRAVPKSKGKGSGGPELQVDKHGDGGARSNSNPEPKSPVRGVENAQGDVVSTTKGGLQGSGKSWVYRRYSSK